MKSFLHAPSCPGGPLERERAGKDTAQLESERYLQVSHEQWEVNYLDHLVNRWKVIKDLIAAFFSQSALSVTVHSSYI